MTREELLAKFTDEQVANANLLIDFRMTPAGVLSLIANVQLALRHPSNDGQAADLGRCFIEAAIEKLRQHNLPISALIAEMGNDTAHDFTPGESPSNPAPN